MSRINYRSAIVLIVAICGLIFWGTKSCNAAKNNQLNLKSSYVDYANKTKITKNVCDDYGMVSNGTLDQSAKLQAAIDNISAKGGGKLIIPKGEYCFVSVYMKSNVHIMVEKGAILRPYWGTKRKIAMLNFSTPKDVEGKHLVNCSIRGLGGKFIVDYSNLSPFEKWGIRFIVVSQVKNFSISDVDIKDCFTTYCGIIFTPSNVKGANKWEVYHPTNGQIINCSINNADPGYGLCQLHGARNLYFENLYAKGGVTLRLETGANTPYIGVYDIYARNIRNENGRCAMMMGPHIAQNGTVKADGLWSKSSSFAMMIGDGFTSGKHKDNSEAQVGRFADDSEFINIHAIFGTDCQLKNSSIRIYDPKYYSEFSYQELQPFGKWLKGPSRSAVSDGTNCYKVSIRNVTSEGFPNQDNLIFREEDAPRSAKDGWKIIDSLPNLDKGYIAELKAKMSNIDMRTGKAKVAQEKKKKSKKSKKVISAQ